MNKYILLGLHVISLVLLGFGWVLDILHINITAHYIITVELFDERRSVLSTLKNLWQTNNYWPFLLIFLFGVVVPIVKSILLFYLLVVKKANTKIYNLVSSISKWAMADVFVISIFVTFLGAKAMENTTANFEPGFYYFAGYVVLSGIVVTLLKKVIKNEHTIELPIL